MVELSGGSGITAKGLMQAAAEGEAAATQILRETTRWLARGLLMVIRILNPDLIILGGGVAQSGVLLLDTLHAIFDELASPTITYSTEIVTAALGNYSPLYGAAAMGLEVP
jgi:glucokinase